MSKFKNGDIVACRSNLGTEKYLTVGKEYEVLVPEYLGKNDIMIEIMGDDGEKYRVSKLRFVPTTETIKKKGKLSLVRSKIKS